MIIYVYNRYGTNQVCNALYQWSFDVYQSRNDVLYVGNISLPCHTK